MEDKNKLTFDEIVFEHRNQDYGAFFLRNAYKRHMTWGLIVGITLILMVTIIPFIQAKMNANEGKRVEKSVVAVMEDIKQAEDEAPPPPPPPPPPPALEQQVKFTAPVVVDSVIEEKQQLATMDQVQDEVKDENVNVVEEVKPTEEIEEKKEPEIFFIVEEMPEFPGGDLELRKYIAENVKYPEMARENGIQGKVFVRFCVTELGGVDKVSIARGIHPLLDEEAIRVVKALPKWKPGKQRGKPVNVWYTVPINFQLQ
jgi:protein TonB